MAPTTSLKIKGSYFDPVSEEENDNDMGNNLPLTNQVS